MYISSCNTAVNIRVYRGFHFQTDYMQYLRSQLGLFIPLDNTYKYTTSEI